MKRTEALKLIDDHKNRLIHPVEMLHWTWLRVIIDSLTEGEWETAVEKATETMSR